MSREVRRPISATKCPLSPLFTSDLKKGKWEKSEKKKERRVRSKERKEKRKKRKKRKKNNYNRITWVKLSWSSLSSQVTLNQESRQGSPLFHPSFSFQCSPAVASYSVSRAFGDWKRKKKKSKKEKKRERDEKEKKGKKERIRE